VNSGDLLKNALNPFMFPASDAAGCAAHHRDRAPEDRKQMRRDVRPLPDLFGKIVVAFARLTSAEKPPSGLAV
jgi:hypothetical protein